MLTVLGMFHFKWKYKMKENIVKWKENHKYNRGVVSYRYGICTLRDFILIKF